MICVHFSVFVRSRFTGIDVYLAALIVLCDNYSHSSVYFLPFFFLPAEVPEPKFKFHY